MIRQDTGLGPFETELQGFLAGLDCNLMLKPAHVLLRLHRAPLATPMNTVFGPLHSRPSLVVTVEDADGTRGLGEIWCNFPPAGVDYRHALARDILPAVAVGASFRNPAHATDELQRRLHTLGLQAGEAGPVAQIVAGLDTALWDLVARRAGKPLFAVLGGRADVPVYASSIPPDEPLRLATAAAERGHTALKLRVGFGRDKDLDNLAALRGEFGDAALMVDANQSWTAPQAVEMAGLMREHRIDWLEEPLPADRPFHEWRRVAQEGEVPLAGGENLRRLGDFAVSIARRAVTVVQPDVGKWGGVSGALIVGRVARSAGLRYCPHWLSGGVGLAASLHVQAGLGGADFVEFDANPNPLRELLCDPQVKSGRVTLPDLPGLGIDPGLKAIEKFLSN
ncbi:mandelate racemase/muconate lactonizing enzyme family protein [Mesorhizobium sp. SP-1A]|uniref:mandelate racemase/muconate lactonizing enzyme family protein n=1 Tax=Mesorhizobium sp. SP-1A TaxID=3077840 RepID=UPI0028F7247B|nr:mandelate racemase/muconate lactonizing enzyme family protein [Mesorhizobium sp. SP-1A]